MYILSINVQAQTELKLKVIWLYEDETAEHLVVPAENYPVVQEQLKLCEKKVEEKNIQNESLEKTIDAQWVELKSCDNVIEKMKEGEKEKEKICEKKIDEAKPSFMDKVDLFGKGMVGGSIFTLIILAALGAL